MFSLGSVDFLLCSWRADCFPLSRCVARLWGWLLIVFAGQPEGGFVFLFRLVVIFFSFPEANYCRITL